MSSKKVLVTGGAGYIGAHVCKALKNSGYLPVTVDNLSTGFLHNVKWGPFHNLDLLDPNALENEIGKYDFEGVIHLAAHAYVEESQADPLKYFSNNLVSTINLLKFMRARDIVRLVFSSSCAVYGKGSGRPFKEDDVKAPINNYGLTKKMCEEIITASAPSFGLKFINLRYFNAGGCDLEGEIFEEHKPETHVIPLLVESTSRGRVFYVHGNDHETNDGSPIRDYVHVLDLADAHVKALGYLKFNGESGAINLGSGKGTSVLDLIESFRTLGQEPKIEFAAPRLGDPPILIADCSLAKEKLGWKPSRSSVTNILKSAVAGRNSKEAANLKDF